MALIYINMRHISSLAYCARERGAVALWRSERVSASDGSYTTIFKTITLWLLVSGGVRAIVAGAGDSAAFNARAWRAAFIARYSLLSAYRTRMPSAAKPCVLALWHNVLFVIWNIPRCYNMHIIITCAARTGFNFVAYVAITRAPRTGRARAPWRSITRVAGSATRNKRL